MASCMSKGRDLPTSHLDTIRWRRVNSLLLVHLVALTVGVVDVKGSKLNPIWT